MQIRKNPLQLQHRSLPTFVELPMLRAAPLSEGPGMLGFSRLSVVKMCLRLLCGIG